MPAAKDEYIKKQRVLEICASFYPNMSDEQEQAILAVWDKVKKLPAEDVRPVVRGKWIKLSNNKLDGSYYCSSCKWEIDIGDGKMTPLEDLDMRFCQYCGADMSKKTPHPAAAPPPSPQGEGF